jgi:hypothetical protein
MHHIEIVLRSEGRVLIYEGHDVARTLVTPGPKSVDQLWRTPSGKLTQNGLFERAALTAKSGSAISEIVAVYEKIHAGIWGFDGMFLLTGAWQEAQLNRKVFKFRLELDVSELNLEFASDVELDTTRIIPSTVKLEVSKRDGKRVLCGAADNLHYDHDVPYSKGGSSKKYPSPLRPAQSRKE